jgi:hypothetical protein
MIRRNNGHQSNLKKTIVKLLFLFHLGNGMFVINITQSTFPLAVLNSMHTRSFLVEKLSPKSSSNDTLLSFMTILRAGSDPEALLWLQFPPSRIIDSLLTDYSRNYSCFRHTTLLAKIKHYNPLRLVIESSGVWQKNNPHFVNMGWGQVSQEQAL